MSETVEVLAEADDPTLELIKRDADEFLKAQLTVALASNQRAMTFFGFLATASAVIGSASITALASTSVAAPFGWAGIVTVVGFLAAMFSANRAAMPDGFSYVGNDPDLWVDDVAELKPLKRSKAEALADSSRCINRNKIVMDRSAQFTAQAVWLAWGSMALGMLTAAITAGLIYN